MIDKNQNPQAHNNGFPGVLAGVLIGGLAGASAMLLVAPQSGEKTRMLIQEKSLELRDETTGMLEAYTARVWLARKRITRDVRRKYKELLHHGQMLIIDQIDNASEAAKAWRKENLGS